MQIIFYKKDKVYRIINTDVCADFRNENFEITYQHGNYRHTMSTEDIGNTQEILDYIAYCLKEKKEICEVPSKDYEDWKSRLYTSEEDLKKLIEEFRNLPLEELKKPPVMSGYIATYKGIPIEELQKAYEEEILYKECKKMIDKWIDYDNIPIRNPHCGHKISNEEREEAIKRVIAKAYLFDKKDKK